VPHLSRVHAPVYAAWSPDDQVIRGDLVAPRVRAMGSPKKKLVSVDADSETYNHVRAEP